MTYEAALKQLPDNPTHGQIDEARDMLSGDERELFDWTVDDYLGARGDDMGMGLQDD